MAAHGVTTAQSLTYPRLAPQRSTLAVADAIPTARIARTASAWCLIALMAVGSVAVWTVVPLGGLWLASQLTDSITRLSAGACLVVAVGIPAAMALAGKALACLERLYMRVTDTTPVARVQPAWRRSISDSRDGSSFGVLDRLVVASVLVAAVALVGWFFLFAGPSV